MDVIKERVRVEEHFKEPSAEYPDGSYLKKVGEEVTVATGYYATLYSDKPSLDWHGKPPVVFVDTSDWPDRTPEPESEKESTI